jgi:hypothetical protein
VTIQQRLALTADRSRVVLDTDPEAATLWSIPGREVSQEEAERLGVGPDGCIADRAPEPQPEGATDAGEAGAEGKEPQASTDTAQPADASAEGQEPAGDAAAGDDGQAEEESVEQKTDDDGAKGGKPAEDKAAKQASNKGGRRGSSK